MCVWLLEREREADHEWTAWLVVARPRVGLLVKILFGAMGRDGAFPSSLSGAQRRGGSFRTC